MFVMTSPWPPYSPDFDAAPPQPPMPWSSPQTLAPAQRPDYGIRRDLGLAVLVIVTLAVAGVVCGFLWHAISPRPHVIEGAGGSFQLPADTDKNYFGAEASFLALAAAAGLLAGVLVWRLGRGRGPAIAVALALGSAAGGLIARLVGESQHTNETLARACGSDPSYDAICQVYDGHLHLRVASLTLAWAIVALASFLALSLIVDREPRALSGWPPPDPLTQYQAPPPVPQSDPVWAPPGYPPRL
jgi:hypothetical protein